MVKLSPLRHGAGGHGGDRVRVDGAAPRGRADKGGGAVADPTLAIETIARMGHPQFRNGPRVGHPATSSRRDGESILKDLFHLAASALMNIGT